jgi:hypothetical protein
MSWGRNQTTACAAPAVGGSAHTERASSAASDKPAAAAAAAAPEVVDEEEDGVLPAVAVEAEKGEWVEERPERSDEGRGKGGGKGCRGRVARPIDVSSGGTGGAEEAVPADEAGAAAAGLVRAAAPAAADGVADGRCAAPDEGDAEGEVEEEEEGASGSRGGTVCGKRLTRIRGPSCDAGSMRAGVP